MLFLTCFSKFAYEKGRCCSFLASATAPVRETGLERPRIGTNCPIKTQKAQLYKEYDRCRPINKRQLHSLYSHIYIRKLAIYHFQERLIAVHGMPGLFLTISGCLFIIGGILFFCYHIASKHKLRVSVIRENTNSWFVLLLEILLYYHLLGYL